MKIIRVTAALVLLTAGVWAATVFVFRPISCYRLKGELYASSYRAYQEQSDASRVEARTNIQKLEKCLAPGCRDIPLYFMLALNYRTIGRPETALSYYRQALRYDRRPEIYANIGDTQLALGNREEAYQNYLRAALFFPGYLRLIDDVEVKMRVRNEIASRSPEHRRAVERVESRRFDKWMGRF